MSLIQQGVVDQQSGVGGRRRENTAASLLLQRMQAFLNLWTCGNQGKEALVTTTNPLNPRPHVHGSEVVWMSPERKILKENENDKEEKSGPKKKV